MWMVGSWVKRLSRSVWEICSFERMEVSRRLLILVDFVDGSVTEVMRMRRSMIVPIGIVTWRVVCEVARWVYSRSRRPVRRSQPA